jgi:hypothetical protein
MIWTPFKTEKKIEIMPKKVWKIKLKRRPPRQVENMNGRRCRTEPRKNMGRNWEQEEIWEDRQAERLGCLTIYFRARFPPVGFVRRPRVLFCAQKYFLSLSSSL